MSVKNPSRTFTTIKLTEIGEVVNKSGLKGSNAFKG